MRKMFQFLLSNEGLKYGCIKQINRHLKPYMTWDNFKLFLIVSIKIGIIILMIYLLRFIIKAIIAIILEEIRRNK